MIYRKENEIVGRIGKVHGDSIEINEKIKLFSVGVSKIKHEIGEFPKIFVDIQAISESIGECCARINHLDKILTEKVIRKNNERLLDYEKKQYGEVEEEENKLT